MTPAERFWARVDTSAGPTGCWPFSGRGGRGYGNFWDGAAWVRAARFSLALSLGRPLAAGMQACHRCDNPPCVNPAHLFEGSPRANALDASAKGRLAARLSWETVAAIRQLAAGGHGVRPLARRFGVNHSTISRIVRGQLWRDDRPAVAL